MRVSPESGVEESKEEEAKDRAEEKEVEEEWSAALKKLRKGLVGQKVIQLTWKLQLRWSGS